MTQRPGCPKAQLRAPSDATDDAATRQGRQGRDGEDMFDEGISRWVMNLQDPGAQHRQSTWLTRAHDTELPLWQRVAMLAYGCHKSNGHANFEPGYLAGVLDKPSAAVSRAIAKSKAKGWIGMESTARCLVVRPDTISGGLGHQHAWCRVHDKKPRGQ